MLAVIILLSHVNLDVQMVAFFLGQHVFNKALISKELELFKVLGDVGIVQNLGDGIIGALYAKMVIRLTLVDGLKNAHLGRRHHVQQLM